MTELERILDQLQRALDGPAWHGPSVSEALQGVTSTMAARRPIATAHTIWELVLHMTVWKDVVRRRALGEAFSPTDEQDWPEVQDTSEAAWQEAQRSLRTTHEALTRVVASFDPARLETPLVAKGSTAYVQFHGVVQHDLWHAGQIVILRKA